METAAKVYGLEASSTKRLVRASVWAWAADNSQLENRIRDNKDEDEWIFSMGFLVLSQFKI
jgi:hypothetical protein